MDKLLTAAEATLLTSAAIERHNNRPYEIELSDVLSLIGANADAGKNRVTHGGALLDQTIDELCRLGYDVVCEQGSDGYMARIYQIISWGPTANPLF